MKQSDTPQAESGTSRPMSRHARVDATTVSQRGAGDPLLPGVSVDGTAPNRDRLSFEGCQKL